jgi:hypothetical protein
MFANVRAMVPARLIKTVFLLIAYYYCAVHIIRSFFVSRFLLLSVLFLYGQEITLRCVTFESRKPLDSDMKLTSTMLEDIVQIKTLAILYIATW